MTLHALIEEVFELVERQSCTCVFDYQQRIWLPEEDLLGMR
jgi:hypothetical protein